MRVEYRPPVDPLRLRTLRDTVRTREIGQLAWVDLEILVDGSARVGGSSEIKGQVIDAVSKALDRKMRIVVYLKPVPV